MRRRLTHAVPLIVLCACSNTPTPSACPYESGGAVLVVAVAPDYSSSGVGALPLDGSPASLLFGSQLGADPALATSVGRHFFIARDRDTIFETDECGDGLSELSARAPGECTTTTTGSCVNPQDVAVASDGSLWVARFDVPSVLVIPNSGSMAPDNVVDMSAFDTTDGNPEMSSVRIIGGNAFIALERLTRQTDGTYVSQQPSQMAVLDTTSLATVATVTLAGRDPFGLMVESSGSLWLAEPGSFGGTETDAGIEVFDTTSMTSKLIVTSRTLGGWVAQVAPGVSCAAAIVAQALPDPQHPTPTPTWLVSFAFDSTMTVTNLKTVIQPTVGYDLQGLVWTPQNELLVGDWRGPPFLVHTFTATTSCDLMPGPDLTVPMMPALALAK
jgi:hypothetical protein